MGGGGCISIYLYGADVWMLIEMNVAEEGKDFHTVSGVVAPEEKYSLNWLEWFEVSKKG